MNSFIKMMLTYIPPSYSIEPQDVPALTIEGTGSVTLDDLTLYIASGLESRIASLVGVFPLIATQSASVVDLHKSLVSEVATQLPIGLTTTVLQNGPAELLLWPDGYGSPQSGVLPITLTIATNPLWQVLAAISREKTTERRTIQQNMGYTNLRTAVGMWLDWWSASLGISRYPSEPDSLLITRLIGMSLNPNVNNVAIQQLFASLGYTVSVIDVGPGQLQVEVLSYPTNPPGGFTYSQSQLQSIISQLKASGIILSFYVQYTITDMIKFSDTLTVTGPTSDGIYGTSKYGVGTYD